MLSISEALKLTTEEELLEELAEHIKVRDKMGGDMWRAILHDECRQIAEKCLAVGVPHEEVQRVWEGN